MTPKTKAILESLTAAQLKQMLAVKERADELAAARKDLASQLTKVEKEIAQLLGGAAAPAPRKTAAKKKAAKKSTGKKRGRPPKAAAEAKGAAKKPTKQTTKTAPRTKAPTAARLEDVVVQVIKAGGGKLAFPEILSTITSQKLYASKSKNFDNVLRRTISTSKKVKRVSRGVYSAK
ncbi:MAG: hypothetical protein AB7V45_17370 [Candidatus Krumholzibacteriia bacterium]